MSVERIVRGMCYLLTKYHRIEDYRCSAKVNEDLGPETTILSQASR